MTHAELKQEQLRVFMQTVMAFHHKPYIWGGNDPDGVDCSGLVVAGLQSAGLIKPNDDLTADGLWHRYRAYEVPPIKAQAGSLVFWFTGNRAHHVAVCVGSVHCLTADRGGSAVKTREAAKARDAWVRILPIAHRNAPCKVCDIWG